MLGLGGCFNRPLCYFRVDRVPEKPRIGVSECLLGRQVRFDGGHKRHAFLAEALAPHVEYVAVCPEVEVGMGVPRETLRLVTGPRGIDMVGNRTGTVYTDRMETWAARRADQLAALELDGYVLKKDSPSCGIEGVPVHSERGGPSLSGSGLFAAVLSNSLRSVPLVEDGWLHDSGRRESFLCRVFTHHRLRAGLGDGASRAKLVELHAAHKFLYMAHSPEKQVQLGRIVAAVAERRLEDVISEYIALAMQVLAIPTTAGKHINVLHHILGFFKDVITGAEKAELLALIEHYRDGVHGLETPLALLVHHLRRYRADGWLAAQVYLEPYPRELLSR